MKIKSQEYEVDQMFFQSIRLQFLIFIEAQYHVKFYIISMMQQNQLEFDGIIQKVRI
jgi:hypothetical protein